MALNKSLIALAGYANSGKDEVIKVLVEEGFIRTAWADPVCRTVAYQFNLPYKRLQGLNDEDRMWREQPHPNLGGKTPREALQYVGHSTRDFYPNCWVDHWSQSYLRKYTNWPVAVSGTRYLNEAETIHALGGKLWFVEREGVKIGNHYSEKGELPLLKEKADVIIYNTGSLGDLRAMAKALAQF